MKRVSLSTVIAPDDAKKVIDTYVGANKRTLKFAAKDEEGNPLNLTDKTVTISADLSGTKKIDDQACTVIDAVDGWFDYTPTADEINADGRYRAQVKIDDSGDEDYLEEIVLRVNLPVEDL